MPHRGLFFEAFYENQYFTLPTFTITADEIGEFSRLTRDHNPLHGEDEVFHAEHNPLFKRRVAHGMGTLARVMGALDEAGIIRGTCLAFAGVDVKFLRPVFPEDEVVSYATVIAKEDREGFDTDGYVTFRVESFKVGKPVLTAVLKILVKRKRPGLGK